VLIERKSLLTGKSHSREIAITEQAYYDWYNSATLIQVAFPNLSDDDREFLLTGITPDEWDEAFKPEDEL
jgi:hypothetical protein